MPDLIRRLERTFRVAYESDKFKSEMREALLCGQIHAGLRPDLMQNSTVSGVLTYKKLRAAACTEEQRKKEMKRKRQYCTLETIVTLTENQRKVTLGRRQVNRHLSHQKAARTSCLHLLEKSVSAQSQKSLMTADHFNCMGWSNSRYHLKGRRR